LGDGNMLTAYQAKPSQAKPSQAKPSQAKPSQAKLALVAFRLAPPKSPAHSHVSTLCCLIDIGRFCFHPSPGTGRDVRPEPFGAGKKP